MKLLNKKQKNNAGFSLVELIVVIAIMVVLVAVLAPLFSKYIESSRRSTDVQNANSIAEAVQADYADGKTYAANTEATAGTPTALKDNVVTKGDAVGKDKKFVFTYDPSTNHCAVYVEGKTGDGCDLTNESNATDYKNGEGAFAST